MTSPFRDLPLRARAIALMKEGHTADALHVQFVNEGENPEEVRSVLTELVALQHQAAAMDPARLRGEAKWMFERGASAEDIAAHFVRAGIPDGHARPEAQRLHHIFRQMTACQRCGRLTAPQDLIFDMSGLSICAACSLQDEIKRSENRGVARDLEMIGSFGGIGVGLATAMVANAITSDGGSVGHTATPFCAHCRRASGVHVSTLPANSPAHHAGWQWACQLCGNKIA